MFIERFWGTGASAFFNRLEELTIVIFLPLAVIELIKNKDNINELYLLILLPIIFICISGLLSGIVNGNKMIVSLHGIFAYIKYFLVIFIYAAFFSKFSQFARVFYILLAIAVIIGIIASVQEIWALSNRYLLHIRPEDILYLNLTQILKDTHLYTDDLWRLGLFRATSLMINSNFMGLYILLMLVIYINVVDKVDFKILCPLVLGIVSSVSRVVYISFILIGCIQLLRKKSLWIAIIPVVLFLLYLSPLPNSLMVGTHVQEVDGFSRLHGEESGNWDAYRAYTRAKSIEIWKDYALLGIGPGMFGGAISLKYGSHVYEEYNFDKMSLIRQWQTLDQFWPQTLAELGISGFIFLAVFFISLIAALLLLIMKHKTSCYKEKGLYLGLTIAVSIILIYTLGYDLGIPPIIFTYCAFVGMGLGSDKTV